MSLERVLKALIDLGLPRVDAEVFVYITKNSPITLLDLTEKLRIKEKNLDLILKNLQNINIIKMIEKPLSQFSTVPFEKALALLIEINKEQNKALQETKREILSNWRRLSKNQPIDN